MSSSPEQTRDIQREIVYGSIRNQVSRELLRKEVPDDITFNKREYGNRQKQMNFSLLLQNEGGNIYSYLLGIAATAKNPNQLSNAISSFGVLSSLRRYSQQGRDQVDQAENEFLGKTYPPVEATAVARSMEGTLLSIWNKTKHHEGILVDYINQELTPFNNKEQINKYMIESFILTLIDKNIPVEFKKFLLRRFESLSFGNSSYTGVDGQFGASASIWKNVDASWVLPELFGAKGFNGDPRDREIAELRYKLRQFQNKEDGVDTIDAQKAESQRLEDEISQLRNQLEEKQRRVDQLTSDNYRLQQSNAGLKEENARLRHESTATVREPARRSPWDVLGIDRQMWEKANQNKDTSAMRQMLNTARRPLLMKYHPDQHPSVRTDPVVKELMDERAKEINKAVDDLVVIYKLPRV